MHKPVKDYGLKFHPKAGAMLICDFRGFILPEIVKRRPVIVITPRLAHRNGLCTIVPLSTTDPKHPQPFHVRLSQNYMPNKGDSPAPWAKCDLVCRVSMARLDRIKAGHRKFIAPSVTAEDLQAIRNGVFAALGLPRGGI